MTHAVPVTQASFDPYLRSFQTAFTPELSAAVRRLRLTGGERVLDVPCGDGFYTELLAHEMSSGLLIGVDQSEDSLAVAKQRFLPSSNGPTIQFRQADAYALPFDAGSFDCVWCAQSLISLDDAVAALREIRRVLRPGGRVAVLETDEFHHVLLPWPLGLELALQKAVRATCRRKYANGAKYSQARKLRGVLLEAGFTAIRKTTVAGDRETPFNASVREFLKEHFAYLRSHAASELDSDQFRLFEEFTSADGTDGLLTRPTAELTVLTSLHHARA